MNNLISKYHLYFGEVWSFLRFFTKLPLNTSWVHMHVTGGEYTQAYI